jgi:hypothetical protein
MQTCPRTAVCSKLSLSSLLLVLGCIGFCLSSLAAFSQNVLTYHNNNQRTGLNSNETALTLTNVNAATFGRLFTLKVDGLVDAQPLYAAAIPVAGATHNVLFVATEHDSVYAFDADSGDQLWKVTTLKAGETTSDDRGCNQVTPEIGITSTPVIVLHTKTASVLYVVAMSKDSSGNYHQRLHALNLANGAELFKGPVDITAKYPGKGDNSSDGYVIFDPAQYKERESLLLFNNTVYLSWASHCDDRPYTGWILGYNTSTLAQTSILNLTPNGNEGAIWGSGGGMAQDAAGNIYLLDANGYFDTTLTAAGFPDDGDYGNAFLRISTTGGKLAVADYFEMENQAEENGSDTDLGSGEAMLVSATDPAGKMWDLAVGAGKDSNLYVVDRTDMGKFKSNDNKIYQELDGALPGGVWSTPAFYDGRVYYGPVGSPILEFQFKNAKLISKPVEKTTISFGYPGASPSISSNNAGANAILWATENTNPAVMHAYNAQTLVEIYNTNQAANGRDHFGAGNKFVTPTIANGKVYVGTTDGVGVFGLLK